MAPRISPLLTSTTPTYPPPGSPALLLSTSLPAPAPSPFLEADPPGLLLALPESPIPTLAFPVPTHRHNLSTSSAPPVIQDPGRGEKETGL